MSPLALVPKGVWAVRPCRASSELETKPSLSQLRRRRIKLTCLKPPAITALALAVLILVATLPQSALAAPGKWSFTDSMGAARNNHTATCLTPGRVLAAGGYNPPSYLASAELYGPASGNWTSIGNMGTERENHTATLLPNGEVLVAGGLVGAMDATASAELLRPRSSTTWAWVITGDMLTQRIWHTATLLLNGKVLVAGGYNYSFGYLASAELFDPATGTWTATGDMSTPRQSNTATLLPNGKVLVAGGYAPYNTLASCELYDPATGTWSATGDMGTARNMHTATRLPNGKVLVAGGVGPSVSYLASAEIYEPEPPPKVQLPALLAFYPFESNAHDVSGNGRHGTVTGSPQPVKGYQGQAYSFNGATDYITAPLNINPGQYPKLTMGAWAKTASSWPLQQLLTHDDGNFDRSIGIDFRGNGIGWSAFCGPAGQVLGAVPAFLDGWTFVAVVYDQKAQTVKFQVEDMVLTKTGVTLGPGQNQLFIGASPLFNVFFAGVIDNVFVFGDALTDEQLAYIRSGGAQTIMTAARKANPSLLLLLLSD